MLPSFMHGSKGPALCGDEVRMDERLGKGIVTVTRHGMTGRRAAGLDLLIRPGLKNKCKLMSETDAEDIQITVKGLGSSRMLKFINSSRRNQCFGLAGTKPPPASPFLEL